MTSPPDPTTKTAGTSDLGDVLEGIIETAIAIAEADFGNIQLLGPDGHLRIVAQRGFPDWWVEYWNLVTTGHGACGTSLSLGERVIVEDVEQSPIFVGTPALDVQRKAGVRAVQSTPLRSRSGQVLGMFSTHYRTPHRPDAKTLKVLDLLASHAATVIEHTRVEEALRTTQQRLQYLVSSSPAVIYTSKVSGDYGATFISDNVVNLMGYAPHEFVEDSKFWANHIHPEDRPRVVAELSAIHEHGEYSHEYRFLHKDGGYRWMRDVCRLIRDADGKPLEVVGYWRDITDGKRQEEEAQEHNELMQSLARQQVAVQTAAAFAHELNQPLVSISAYNEVALRALRSGKTGQLAHVIEASHEQAQRAGRVLRELIDHLHKGEAEPTPFDINELVKAVIDKMRKMEFRKFQATLDLEAGLQPVLGNRLQTEKVLLNLIQNGMEAMRGAGVAPASFSVVVRTQAGRNMAQVTIRDCGPGLAPDTARRIFDPFFTTKPEGLGLGLTISRSLVEAQDGQLWIDPEDGPGAVFHFTLPFAND